MRNIPSGKILFIALLIAAFTAAAEASPWLWNVAGDESALAHLAVVAIAVLSAFLTVAELWSVKAPNTRPVTASSPAVPEGTVESVPMYGNVALLFKSNFARTVLSGLAGLALVATFDDLWGANVKGQKPYFLALFVSFFLVFLFLSAVARGFTEAGRSRISVVRRYPHRDGKWTYPFRRLWLWLLSLRTTLLVFADTVFNVVLGRNQLKTAEFENEIADLHHSIVGAVDRIREEIDKEVKDALDRGRSGFGERDEHPAHKDSDVRVCISVLSQDESALYYISREEGSIARGFGKGSLAWLAVYSGHPLWWRKSYEQHRDRIVLLDNERKGSEMPRHPELKPGRYLLKDHFEMRSDQDYEAFIVLPLPWGHRGTTDDRQKAGIHISFPHERDLDLLWKGLEPFIDEKDTSQKSFSLNEHCDNMIDAPRHAKGEPHLKNSELAANLKRNIPLLSELLRHFNDTVFEEYIRPRLQPQ